MERVLIAGCGDVGCALAGRLTARGVEVWGLRRTIAALPPGVRGLAADLSDPAGWPSLPTKLDAVVYSAAPDGRDEASYRAVYVEGLGHLLERLAGERLHRVIFTSSTGVYGQDAGEVVDESSPTEPTAFTGRCLLEAEAVPQTAPWPAVVVRLGGIYGPGRTRLLEAARRGEPGSPTFSNRIHRDDCAGILDHLLDLDRPEPLYLGVDSEPAPRSEVIAWLRARMGLPALPEAPTGDLVAGKRCSNQRLLASGYRLLYPSFREGYGALLAELTRGGETSR